MTLFIVNSTYENGLTLWLYNDVEHKIVKKPSINLSEHLPYLLTFDDVVPDGKRILSVKKIVKYDALKDKNIQFNKVICSHPGVIFDSRTKSGLRTQLKTSYEDNILYKYCFMYDVDLIFGLPFERFILDKIDEKELMEYYSKLLNTPAPQFKRVALDIEVKLPPEIYPDPERAEYSVNACALVGSDGFKRVLLLGKKPLIKFGPSLFEFYDDEVELIGDIFNLIKEYPVVVTYTGDRFDLLYLYKRALRLGFSKDDIPIIVDYQYGNITCSLQNSLHIDMNRFYLNKLIRAGFKKLNKIRRFGLDDISKALLNKGKLPRPDESSSLEELGTYCLRDSELTLELTQIDNDRPMNILVLLSRMANLTLEDTYRHSVSYILRSHFYFIHRKLNYLIPKPQDYAYKNKIPVKMKGVTFEGGLVIEPVHGIHFNVYVLDFASLYPSVVDTRNISYETVYCGHEECKNNIVPGQGFHICSKRKGILSLTIGAIRNLRVNIYKPKSKDKSLNENERLWYDCVQAALKLFGNAFYGVWGSRNIKDLYILPLAASVTAYGRDSIRTAIKVADEMGIKTLYGDSVSGKEKILVKINDSYKLMSMEELFSYLEEEGLERTIRNGKEVIAISKAVKIEVPSVKNDYKVSFCPVSSMVRHKANKRMFKLFTKTGFITVTEDHSLFGLDNDLKLKPIPAKNIRKGDYVAVSQKIPLTIPDRKYIDISGLWKKIKKEQPQRVRWHAISLCDGHIITRRLPKSKLRTKIPLDFPLSDNFLMFAGLWLADGYKAKNGCQIDCGLDPECRQPLVDICKEFNVPYHLNYEEESHNYSIRVCSRIFSNVMDYLGLKGTSHTKKIPDWVFGLSNRQIALVLKGYISGDGCVVQDSVNWDTWSRDLNYGIQFLFLRLGIRPNIYKWDKSEGYNGIIGNGREVLAFKEKIGFIQKRQKRKLNHYCKEINEERSSPLIPINKTIRKFLIAMSNYRNVKAVGKHFLERDMIDRVKLYKEKIIKRSITGKYPKNVRWLPNIEELPTQDEINSTMQLIEGDVEWALVYKIEEVENKGEYVYDLSVPPYENFICSGAFIAHNTDSIFLHSNDKEKIDLLLEKVNNKLGIDLEIDKFYRYCILHKKKNYLGVTRSNDVIIKGLIGIKSHMCSYIKNVFKLVQDELIKIQNRNDYVDARININEIVKQGVKNLKLRKVPLKDLIFTIRLDKREGMGQDYDVARQYREHGVYKGAGDEISKIFVRGKTTAKPYEYTEPEEVNVEKYLEHLKSVLEQVLEPLGIGFDGIISDHISLLDYTVNISFGEEEPEEKEEVVDWWTGNVEN